MITDVFCKIIKGELPSEPVYRDDEIIVIKDNKPNAPVHLLVMPIKHFESLDETKQEDASLLGKMLLVANRVAKEANLEKGYRLVINKGEHGGQLVPHLHLHVLGGKHLGSKLVQD